ncbi:MAG: SPOR domain-containing protein [Bacteroidota bacterium]
MMIRFFLLFFLLASGYQMSHAQIIVREPATVSQMLNRYTEINKRTTRIKGYRILIYSTRDRGRMERTLRDFQYQYPNVGVDWVHDRPDYKVRAGAFESKSDARRLLYIIRQDYPNASIMTDTKMNPGELIF